MTTMTPGMRRVLTLMRDAGDEGRHEDVELVCEGIRWLIGTERTRRAVARLLLQSTLVRDASDEGGHRALRHHRTGQVRPEILATRGGFTVVDDRPVALPG